jgi:hypothetical protein
MVEREFGANGARLRCRVRRVGTSMCDRFRNRGNARSNAATTMGANGVLAPLQMVASACAAERLACRLYSSHQIASSATRSSCVASTSRSEGRPCTRIGTVQ